MVPGVYVHTPLFFKHEEERVVDKPFPPGPQPPGLDGPKPARTEQLLPLTRTLERERDAHPPAVTVAVQPSVEPIQPEAFQAVPVHRFHDDHTPPGHAKGLIQDGRRLGAVMERQQEQRRIEGGVTERQAGAVVDHVGAGGLPEGPHVHGAGPDVCPLAKRPGDVAFARPQVEHSPPDQERRDGGRLNPGVAREEGLDESLAQHLRISP